MQEKIKKKLKNKEINQGKQREKAAEDERSREWSRRTAAVPGGHRR
jgi:hypothetical protein